MRWITSTAWSYGVTGQESGCSGFYSNSLIGVSQVGLSLAIVSFTLGTTDYPEPVGQVTYTLTQ